MAVLDLSMHPGSGGAREIRCEKLDAWLWLRAGTGIAGRRRERRLGGAVDEAAVLQVMEGPRRLHNLWCRPQKAVRRFMLRTGESPWKLRILAHGEWGRQWGLAARGTGRPGVRVLRTQKAHPS